MLRVAGDAVIALFRDDLEDGKPVEGIGQSVLTACACASLCVQKLNDHETLGIKLGLHIAIGAGSVHFHYRLCFCFCFSYR